MLNYKKGVPIAYIKLKNKKNKIIYLDKNYVNNKSNNNIDEENEKEIKKGLIKPICKYCNKEYYSNWDLKVHQKKSCKKKEIYKLNKKISNLKKNIENGKNDESSESIESDENREKNKDNENKIKINEGEIIPLPRDDIREILYIAGAQGSGKSYYTKQYLEEFKKKFKNHDMFLFSRIEKDSNFKNLIKNKKLVPIKLNESLLNDPIDAKKELLKSVVVFDDIETMNKNMTKYLELLRNDIIKNGRDQNKNDNDIYCVCTNHQITDYKKTRDLLNECTSLTIFPKSGSSYGMDRALKLYFGLSNDQISKIKKLPSRWVTIYSTYPQYVLYQKGCYLLSD